MGSGMCGNARSGTAFLESERKHERKDKRCGVIVGTGMVGQLRLQPVEPAGLAHELVLIDVNGRDRGAKDLELLSFSPTPA